MQQVHFCVKWIDQRAPNSVRLLAVAKSRVRTNLWEDHQVALVD